MLLNRIAKSIRLKIALPIFIVLVLFLVFMNIMIYRNQSASLKAGLHGQVREGVEKIAAAYKEAEDFKTGVMQLNQESSIAMAKLIAREIKANPGVVTTEGLHELITQIGRIDEIHIIDEKGVIVCSSEPSVIGFDFNTSDQTKPFLQGINDPNFTLAQDPAPRGADGKYFQYIGVGRLDKPGIVQIGISPTLLSTLIEKNSLQKLVERNTFGSANPWICDAEGNFLFHQDKSFIGKNLRDIGVYDKIIGKASGDFEYTTAKGEKRLVSFEKIGSEYMGVTGFVDTAIEGARKGSIFFDIIALIGLAITGAIIYFVILFVIAKPINEMKATATAIAAGDLSQTLQIRSNDEVGILAQTFNSMTDNLRNLIKGVSSSSASVSANSQELAAITGESANVSQQVAVSIEDLATVASKQAENTQQGAEVLRELVNSIRLIMQKTREVLDASTRAESLSHKGVDAVKDQLEKMTESKETSGKMIEIIRGLANQAEDVVKIVNTIQAISNQTNLLALNAAIEAARAGEHGRGFSVVAEEVRGLAEETGQATTQVEEIIRSIKSNIEVAVDGIYSANEAVQAQAASVTNTNQTFTEIAETIRVLSGRVNEIVRQNEKNSAGVDSILQMIDHLSEGAENAAASAEEASASTEEQTAAIEQISHSAEELAALAGELQDMVAKFKL